MASLASEIRTELDAEWNAGVIAEPSFYNWNVEGNTAKKGIYVGDGGSGMDKADFRGDIKERIRIADFMLVHNSEVNVELLYEEFERIVESKSVTSGEWAILNYTYQEIGAAAKIFIIVGQVQELKLVSKGVM